MPKGLVEGERDERLWKRAKALVRKQYPEVAEDSDRFWRLVNGIYGKMRKGEAEGGRGPGRGLGTGRGRGRKDGTGPRAGTPACPVEKAAEEPPVGSGERFRRLQGKLARRGDVRDPGAVAAAIGRKKYGPKRFQEMAAAGRARKSVRPLLIGGGLADLLRKAVVGGTADGEMTAKVGTLPQGCRIIYTYGSDEIQVTSPYNADFAKQARKLGGRWIKEAKWWVFPISQAFAVRMALMEHYGEEKQNPPAASAATRESDLVRGGEDITTYDHGEGYKGRKRS